MPDYQIYTNEGAIALATEVKTALALSKLLLFQEGLVPTRYTLKAALTAAECDFDGYTPGGYTLTAWTGPANQAGGGAVITSPLTNIAYGPAEDPPVTNMVGGWWIEDASGDVRTVGVFDPPRAMQVVGDVINWLDQIVLGKNAQVVSEE